MSLYGEHKYFQTSLRLVFNIHRNSE